MIPGIMSGLAFLGGAKVAALISRTLGTNFGDMTSGGRLAAAFDGTTSQASTGCANKASTSGYIGKDYGSGVSYTITQVKIYAPNNTGYVFSGTPTLSLYGSNSAPASGTNGTLLATTTATNTANTITTLTPSSPQSFRYNWVYLTSSFSCVIAEVEFTGY